LYSYNLIIRNRILYRLYIDAFKILISNRISSLFFELNNVQIAVGKGLPHETYGNLTLQAFQIEQSQSTYFVLHFHFKAQTTVHEHHKNKHLVHKSIWR